MIFSPTIGSPVRPLRPAVWRSVAATATSHGSAGSGVTDGARQTRLAKSAARRPPPDRTLGGKTVGGRSMKAKWFRSGPPGAAARLGLLLTLAAAAGCSQAAPGHVSGQVQFNGKPLPGGTITFL